jgi:hypothetical protein
MLRFFFVFAAAVAGLSVIAVPAQAQGAYTTRIEPRAVYGATVSIEEGVRVFRPLPSEQHVIVNPGGLAPLSLGYYDPRLAPYYYGAPAARSR